MGKKTAPMFVHFGKVRNSDISKKSEKLHNILQHVSYLNYKFYVILIKTLFFYKPNKIIKHWGSFLTLYYFPWLSMLHTSTRQGWVVGIINNVMWPYLYQFGMLSLVYPKAPALDFGGLEEGCLVRWNQNQSLGFRWQEIGVEKGRRGFEW